MSKRMLLCASALLVLLLPISKAQSIPARGSFIPISTYRDDPFVAASVIEQLAAAKFSLAEDGRRILWGELVTITEAAKIYRRDQTNTFKPFAWNPWPAVVGANEQGDFRFPDEARFPLFKPERGPDGKIILKDGLQVWTPLDQRLGVSTAFVAAHATKAAAESWAGRDIVWGVNGVLDIEPHAFIDFNAFYSPSTRSLFFAIVPYRLPSETQVKLFETVTAWELVAHECGHALHDILKPNVVHGEPGYDTWSESFGDQTAMWTSLQNRERVRNLLAETNGDFHQSNSLSRLVEAFAALIGKGTGIRDAFHDKKVSDTEEEEHDRSEVFTGAAYSFFLTVYDELKRTHEAEEALRQAGQILGFFLTRATDYTPENQMTLEDVAKAYLKVDKEFFGSRYHQVLVDEFTRREIFDGDSVREWWAHEVAVPQLFLHPQWSDEKIEQVLQANLDKLGIGPDFGLKLQSVTRIENASRGPLRGRGPAQTIVRVQLTQGRGAQAQPLDNHGILVFRPNGLLADYHTALPSGEQTSLLSDAFVQTQALARLDQAEQLRLDQRGVPLSIVRQPNGQLTVEARVLRGQGLNTYLEVFTLDKPQGERREIVIPPVPSNQRLHIANDLLK
jgi:hypothetical protein